MHVQKITQRCFGCSQYDLASQTAAFLQSNTHHKPVIGIICGSGLGELADQIDEQNVFDFKEIPNFPVSTGEYVAW